MCVHYSLIKNDIDDIISWIYDFTLTSFVCESISLLLGCCVVGAFVMRNSKIGFGVNIIKILLIISTLVLDIWTVVLIDSNDVSQIFQGLVNNDCFTRDSERDIAELASNVDQILTFGIVEAVIDFLALLFDGCSMCFGFYVNNRPEVSGIVTFAMNGISVFFDVTISAINFFGYVIPAFDTYNKQHDAESRCYSFAAESLYNSSVNDHNTPYTTTTKINSSNGNNNNDQVSGDQVAMIVLTCIVLLACSGMTIISTGCWDDNTFWPLLPVLRGVQTNCWKFMTFTLILHHMIFIINNIATGSSIGAFIFNLLSVCCVVMYQYHSLYYTIEITEEMVVIKGGECQWCESWNDKEDHGVSAHKLPKQKLLQLNEELHNSGQIIVHAVIALQSYGAVVINPITGGIFRAVNVVWDVLHVDAVTVICIQCVGMNILHFISANHQQHFYFHNGACITRAVVSHIIELVMC